MKPTQLVQITGLSAMLAVAAAGLTACSDQSSKAAPESAAVADKAPGAICAAHEAPKELCFICDPSLREKGRLWCNEHARYEDRCWLCHPELEDKDRLYCKEHSLYEDECFLCHPELLKEATPAGQETGEKSPSAHAPQAAALFCTEHGVLEIECGICHPELLNESESGRGLKVRLPSETSAERAGVVVGRSATDRMVHGVNCLAELTFDLNNLAQITPLVDGIVKSVEVDLGSHVKEGDLLARITSVAIGEAQAAYVKALAENRLQEKVLERERKLRAQNISSESDLLQAEAAHESAMASVRQARQRLTVFGFDEQQIETLGEEKEAGGVLEIRAPFAGEIVERAAVRGAMAALGKPLFTLADTGKLWAMVDIPESQLPRVQVGQTVDLTVESLPDQQFRGKLTWLASQVDERTRMARGRVEVANPDGRLKAQMFARAHIVRSNSDHATIVPREAVQDLNGTPVVFIASGPDLFEARPVRLGASQNGMLEVISGLDPNEPVAVGGTFALKSQFLISRLGAGCVH